MMTLQTISTQLNKTHLLILGHNKLQEHSAWLQKVPRQSIR